MEDGGSTAVTHDRSALAIAIMRCPYNCWGGLRLSTCMEQVRRMEIQTNNRESERQVIPEEFNAAGLIVPDPSII
jgi:hypothetical protein